MAEEKKKKPAKQRSSSNELELMKEILEEHQGLFLRVMDVLRRSRNRESIFDEADRKQKIVKNNMSG